jgi:hypothetical protein
LTGFTAVVQSVTIQTGYSSPKEVPMSHELLFSDNEEVYSSLVLSIDDIVK